MKTLMTGNEAIARGVYEYGVSVAAAYPGTPSTEILENIAKYPEVYSQWSPNEKVAMEVGIGAAIAGARAIVAMKMVGVNVAADPLFTVAYTGTRAGLVLVSADDPGMHSSQNEQDNRLYAAFAKIPLLEPSNSQEAKDMVGLAMDISEAFDTPVMIRITTRIAHSQSLVELKDPQERQVRTFERNPRKYVMLPANGRARRLVVEERMYKLAAYTERVAVNYMELQDLTIGIITSGISYQYVKEALPAASILKLGLTNPLPSGLIKEFAAKVDKLYVVEELEPYMEKEVRLLGINVIGKELFPPYGELSVRMVSEKISGQLGITVAPAFDSPIRPPVMCPGCPHRGMFFTLKQLKLIVSGDIGCYTLGAMAPLEAMDTTICMGASISAGLGMIKAHPEMAENMVAVIGDSTFLHSGITGLMDVVYNGANLTTIILDNSITAMTGHQENPSTGKTLMGQPAPQVDFVALCKALGVKRITEVDPFDLASVKETIKTEVAVPEPSVIIARRPCALIIKNTEKPLQVQDCNGCKMCLKLGCPAISFDQENKTAQVDQAQCTGCGVCINVCKFNALRKAGDLNA
ncbi:indolepyruvate ferredoxin oxidoreductase subunit alpha [Desulfosporosinus shakirovi]|uniref:indolepyruvate ferredoxin oxidoreductase subunit alpha n=1 Tax=Desulfosporosinus shakirovi TaxID=2885154 RepID=UPI001E543747|nr:indolepyruvate ferredoxin oxidoreductase subunit alpha [Desulfosporosinus sp. SRJS8]MCB8815962.1 indolepyruvate ferredoxin oxidoreductase subunit alpha [Desulfosporosinus sp. SRJS8]